MKMSTQNRIKILKSIQSHSNVVKKAELTSDSIWEIAESLGIHEETAGRDAINFITPTILSSMVGSILGSNFLGVGIDLFLRFLGVDYVKLVEELVQKIKGIDAATMTESNVNSAIDSTIDKYLPTTKTSSNKTESQNLRLLKLAYIHAYQQIEKKENIYKIADGIKPAFSTTNVFLKKLFKKIFKTLIFSAGSSAAVSYGKEMLGLDTFKPKFVGTQVKFKVNPSFSEIPRRKDVPWVEYMDESIPSIKKMLFDWAKEIYVGVTDEDLNKSPVLTVLTYLIKEHNEDYHFPGSVKLPPSFRTKKEVVDYFIDDVARNSSLPNDPKLVAEMAEKEKARKAEEAKKPSTATTPSTTSSTPSTASQDSSKLDKVDKLKQEIISELNSFKEKDFPTFSIENIAGVKGKIEQVIKEMSSIKKEDTLNQENIDKVKKHKNNLESLKTAPGIRQETKNLADSLLKKVDEYLTIAESK